MLKRIIKSVAFLGCSVTAMTGFIGCVADRHDIQQLPEGGVDLVLEISASKTRVDGNDFTKAEKVVKSVDLFFYPEGASDNTPATHHIHTGVTMDTELATSNRGKIRINIEPEDIGLSSSVTSCLVYAAVNTKETEGLSNNITLGELKNKMTSTDWMIKNTLDENGDMPDFEGFAMFTISPGGDVVKLTDENGEAKISGTVTVDKLMSKISLFLGFGSKDEEQDISTWTVSGVNPNEPGKGTQNWRVYQPSEEEKQDGDASVFGDEVELYIVNGVKAARLGGAFAADGSFIPTLADDDYFDLWAEDDEHADNDFMNFAHGFIANGSDSKAKYPYVVESPFYTYPNSWTDGVLNTDTYLILKVNWVPVDGDATNVEDKLLETYYKVPLNKSEGAADQNKILSNCHYSVKVKINTLGGLHFGEPLLLDDCSYELIPWDHMVLDAKLRETRYLEVRQDVVDRDGQHYTGIMNNSERIEIPFYSSHKVEIRSAKVTYYDFQYVVVDETDGEVKPTDRTEYIDNDAKINAFTLTEDLLDTDTPGIFIDEINSRIIIQHKFHPIQLQPSGDRYAHVTSNQGSGQNRVLAETYSPYDFEIELKHKDWMNTDPTGEDFKKDKIKVRQYPARYVDVTRNSGGPDESPWWDFTDSQLKNYGYTYVNGTRDAYGGVAGINKGWWNGFTGGLLGYTENPQMYIVNVTNLNPEDVVDYPLHIGDPRTIYTSNDLWTEQEKTGEMGIVSDHYTYKDLMPTEDDPNPASWSYKAQGWLNHESTEQRQLTNYYPTNETPLNEYRYMVAPKFRISSSYGNANPPVFRLIAIPPHWEYFSFGRVRARKRCASYQEENYPAGRWRLPTPGELFFMVKLQQEDIIPALFSEDEDYWTSHGLYTVKSKTITEQRKAEGAFTGQEAADGEEDGSNQHYVIKGYVRCVYDEWYWNDKNGNPDILDFQLTNDASNDFRWGDKPKNNPQLQPDPETEPEP